jgi:hypothetical protein
MVFKIPYHYHGADLQEVIYTCMHSIPLQLSTNPQGKEIEEKLFLETTNDILKPALLVGNISCSVDLGS